MKARTPTRRTRNRRGEGGLLRDDLVAAASRLLETVGSEEALSLRAVARAVGVATPSIYAHFEDKRALFGAVLEVRFSELRAALRSASEAAATPELALRARCQAYCRYALEHPGSYRVMFSAVPSDGHRRALEELPGAAVFQDVAASIEACRAGGVAVPLPSFDAAVLVWSTLHGLISLRVGKPGFPWPEIDRSIEQLLETVCGCRPPRTARRTSAG